MELVIFLLRSPQPLTAEEWQTDMGPLALLSVP